ncbi:MAG: DUF3644 domain-containing protein [Candidatus Brocadiales bacterium]|nr:DUF3644 domain-containing protein [Candidatus Brocadiales bacterium]
MLAAIELHNKPRIDYRYEIVILLINNAWELLLKAYIYKNLKSIKLFRKDGTSKDYRECISAVFSNLGKEYFPVRDNVTLLYDYRNEIAHFYTGHLEPLVYTLIKKSVQFYVEFVKIHFAIDLSADSGLVLLPIGFRPIYSPIDYLSKQSSSANLPTEVHEFLEKIIKVTQALHEEGIQESVLGDFSIGLINESRTKNADIIVGTSKLPQTDGRTIQVIKKVVNSVEGPKITLTRDKSISSGVYLHEQLSTDIFEEINNLLKANRLISPNGEDFHLDEENYYRIYSERNNVQDSDSDYYLLAKTSLLKYYAPGIYWFIHMSDKECADLIMNVIPQMKHPNINSFLRTITLLGTQLSDWYFALIDKKYRNTVQKPNFYYTFLEMRDKPAISERRLLAIRMSRNKSLDLGNDIGSVKIGHLIDNPSAASDYLTAVCLKIYNGEVSLRQVARTLDILAYGHLVEGKASDILSEIEKTTL